MAILVECPQCRKRQYDDSNPCARCGNSFSKNSKKVYWIEFYVEGKKRMDVPDPYGATEPEYIRALEIIREGVNALAEEIAGKKPGTTRIV